MGLTDAKFNYSYIRKKIKNLKIKELQKVQAIGTMASIISKDKKIRKLVHDFQINCAYNPPKKYAGSCLDGRDITYKIIPDADFKFFMNADVKVRANRRFKEVKRIK